MKLVLRFELAFFSECELRGLYRESFNTLAASDPGSAERRDALVSLETIERELSARISGP